MYVQHGSATITICSLQPNWTININLSCSLVWTAIVSMAMLSCARTLCLWNDIHILIMFTIIGHYWLSDRSGGGSRDGGSSGSDWFIYFVEIIYGRPVFAYNLYGIPFELYAARIHPSNDDDDEEKFSSTAENMSACMITWNCFAFFNQWINKMTFKNCNESADFISFLLAFRIMTSSPSKNSVYIVLSAAHE